MSDATGIKFMAVASFLLLHLHCDESVSEADVCSHASAVVDGYALSKAPAASRVIPLLNLCTAARRLPLPNLAAHAELHLAFALSASRKHVQVEEVCHSPPCRAVERAASPHSPAADAAARRAHAASLRAHAVAAPPRLPSRCPVRTRRCRGSSLRFTPSHSPYP